MHYESVNYDFARWTQYIHARWGRLGHMRMCSHIKYRLFLRCTVVWYPLLKSRLNYFGAFSSSNTSSFRAYIRTNLISETKINTPQYYDFSVEKSNPRWKRLPILACCDPTVMNDFHRGTYYRHRIIGSYCATGCGAEALRYRPPSRSA